MYHRVFGAQSGRAPQYFPYVGAYGYRDRVTTSVARGGALRCFCPRAQETIVTPLTNNFHAAINDLTSRPTQCSARAELICTKASGLLA